MATRACGSAPWFHWLALLGGTALAFGRGGVSALDTIWAEDATIFLQTALDRPFLEALPLPYAGYLHVFPRLAAEIVAFLPPSLWAAALAGTAALAAAALALFVFEASRAHLPPTRVRLVLALAMLLLPAAGLETTIAICNTHWYLIFAGFWALLWRPRSRAGVAVAAAVAFLAVTSDPFVVLFAPIAVLRIVALPRGRDWVVSMAFALGALLQLAVIATNPEPRPLGFLDRPVDLVRWYGYHVLEGAVFGVGLRDALTDRLGVALPALGAVALLACAFLPVRRLERERFCLLALCGGYHLALYATPVVLAGLSTPRYTITPVLLLLTMVGYVLVHAERFLSRTTSRALRGAIATILLVTWVLDYRPQNPRSEGPAWSSELSNAERACRGGSSGRVTLTVPPRPIEAAGGAGESTRLWTLEVGCARLARAEAGGAEE